MEAHPEENFHTLVQRTSQGAEHRNRQLTEGSLRRSPPYRACGSTLAKESGTLQQETARSRATHGERGTGTGFYQQQRANTSR